MKNIMFVIGVLSNGGAERVISILSKELSNRGYKVDIITIYEEKNDYLDDNRVNIFSLNLKSKNKVKRIFEILYKIRMVLKSRKPDVIISFVTFINMYTIIAKLFLRIPLIISERNDPNQNIQNKLLRFIRDKLYSLSDGFVFQTEDARNYFTPLIREKSIIIPNPVSPNLPKWEVNNTENVIITACRLVKQKNLPLLINSFAKFQEKFPEYKLKIFGTGPLKSELLKLIKDLELENKVILPGFTKDIHSEMVKSKMFVITSNYEGISNAMLEALAIGVPVISTDSPIGGARMFIKNGENGYLVEVGDLNGIVKKMEKLAENTKLANELSRNAMKIRNTLNPENVIKKWIEYLQKVIGEAK